MLKLNIFTSQETEGSVSVLKSDFFFFVFLAAATLEAYYQCFK